MQLRLLDCDISVPGNIIFSFLIRRVFDNVFIKLHDFEDEFDEIFWSGEVVILKLVDIEIIR